jgi:hypothetical protein
MHTDLYLHAIFHYLTVSEKVWWALYVFIIMLVILRVYKSKNVLFDTQLTPTTELEATNKLAYA